MLIEHRRSQKPASSRRPIRSACRCRRRSSRSFPARSLRAIARRFRHLRKELAPFKRIRKIEFVKDLPKTISGKIRRVQLRAAEIGKDDSGWERGVEFAEEDFPELKKIGEREDTAS